MNRIFLIVLTVAALVLAGLVALLLRTDATGAVEAVGRDQTDTVEPRAEVRSNEPDIVRSERAPESSAARPVSELATGARISGRVMDESARPVAGARVGSNRGGETIADDAGAFSLEGLPAGEHWLKAAAPGLGQRRTPPVRVGLGAEARDVLIVLEPMTSFEGAVSDAAGRPIAGAQVELRDALHPELEGALGVSADDGAFRFVAVPTDGVQLFVRHPGHLPFGRGYPSESERVEIVLHPADGITGRVVALDGGAPLAVDRVTLLASADEEAGPWKQAGEPFAIAPEEGAEGRFSVPAPRYRWLRVVAEGPGFAPVASDPLRTGPAVESVPLTLRAQSGVRLTCRALDELGQAIEGAELRVVEPLGADAWINTGAPFVRGAVFSAADGIVRSLPVAPGRYRVELKSAGHFDAVLDGVQVEAGAATIELVLARAASIRGELRAPGGGALPHLRVLARADDGGEPIATTIVDGSFELAPLVPGALTVLLVEGASEEHVRARVEVALEPGERRELDFDMQLLGADLYGRLTCDGVALASTSVSLGRPGATAAWTCTTDRAGGYRFTGVPAGDHLLSARTAPEGECTAGFALQVIGEGEQRFDIEFWTGALAGRLLDEAGAPLAGVEVLIEELLDGEPSQVAVTASDDDGRFELLSVPAGELLLSTRATYRRNEVGIACRAAHGGRFELEDLRLPATGSLIFHLQRRAGMAIPSATEVEARRESTGPPLSQRAFAAGERPLLSELPAGPLELIVRTEDGYETRARAVVAAGKTRTVVVTF